MGGGYAERPNVIDVADDAAIYGKWYEPACRIGTSCRDFDGLPSGYRAYIKPFRHTRERRREVRR